MIAASLYIIVCSARNRARVRLRRLKEPRYLIGAIVGAAYIYFSFFARFRASRSSSARRSGRGGGIPAPFRELAASGPAFAGLGLLGVTVASWILPFNSGMLDFSEAEMQFLFPAPVSRRTLLIYRILRSQIGLLFSSAMIGIGVGISASGFSRLRLSIAVWFLLVTARIYFTGVTLARVRLASHDRRSRRVAWLPIGVLTVIVSIIAVEVMQAYRAAPVYGALALLQLVATVAESGATRVVLWPFVALARPLFAAWPQPYLSALLGSAIVMAVVSAWVLKSDEAFQDAVMQVAERRSQEPKGQKGQPTYKVRSSGWTLAPIGRPETAFAWKGAMQTLRMVDRGTLARIASIMFALTIIASTMGRANGVAALVGAFSFAGTAFAIILAPQVIRIDMRQDLSHLELLKTWPVKAASVVRGELLWPGMMITAAAWTMLAAATFLSGTMFGQVSVGLRLAAGVAIAIVAPALVFAQLAIHNAVALVFPAWVPLGNQRPRGLDAMGQRLIMLGGTWLLLIVGALPGAIAGGIVWFALKFFIGAAALIPAAMVSTVVVGLEILVATEAMGPAYERLDILAVERVE
jgi:ABC-2 type transport system permease protein